MFDTIAGLPLHPLAVHFAVVLVPMAAGLIIAFAVSERFRAWSGRLTPIVTTIALLAAFVADEAGEALEERIQATDLVEKHTSIGGTLAPIMLVVTLLVWGMWWLWKKDRTGADDDGAPSTALKVVAGLAIIAAIGITIDVVLIGDTGARSVWEGIGSSTVSGE